MQRIAKKKFNISIICLKNCSFDKEFKKIGIKVYKIKSNKTFFAMSKVLNITKSLISNKYKKNIFISNIHCTNVLSLIFLRNLNNLKIVLVERTPIMELSIYFGFIDFVKKNYCKSYDGNFYIISIGPSSYKKELKNHVKKFYELKTNRAIYSIFELRRIISKFNYKNNSIFVSNINYANIITILALRRFSNLKIILVERTAIKELDIYFSLKDFIKKKIIKLLVKLFYKKADAIITNSKKSSNSIKILCKTNVKTIYSPAFKKFSRKIKKKILLKRY